MALSRRSHYHGYRHKLTPQVRAEILAAVTAGVPRKLAARLAGVSGKTLAGWLALGRAGGEELSAFLASLKKAEKAVAAKRKNGGAATETLWTSILEFMERRLEAQPPIDSEELKGLRARLDAIETQLKAKRSGPRPPL